MPFTRPRLPPRLRPLTPGQPVLPPTPQGPRAKRHASRPWPRPGPAPAADPTQPITPGPSPRAGPAPGPRRHLSPSGPVPARPPRAPAPPLAPIQPIAFRPRPSPAPLRPMVSRPRPGVSPHPHPPARSPAHALEQPWQEWPEGWRGCGARALSAGKCRARAQGRPRTPPCLRGARCLLSRLGSSRVCGLLAERDVRCPSPARPSLGRRVRTAELGLAARVPARPRRRAPRCFAELGGSRERPCGLVPAVGARPEVRWG